MRLSRKDEHSITAMLELAARDRYAAPVSLTELSERLGISTSYLEHLFTNLRRHGLVEGLRGVGGGYRLARPAAQISIADILSATQAEAPAKPSPAVTQAWDALSRRIQAFLDGLTLADFTSGKETYNWKQQVAGMSDLRQALFRWPVPNPTAALHP